MKQLTESQLWYREYLSSPEWKETSKQLLIYFGFTCQDCNGTANQIHHVVYKYNGVSIVGKELDYRGCVVALCPDCHKARHSPKKPMWQIEQELEKWLS